MQSVDVAIVGGGIVGLATGYQLARNHPQQRVIVLEKEAELAFHQTGRNSGVMHSGIYYKPGTLRATNCRTGKLALEAFCQTEGVDHDVCGKVIVAVSENEFPGLERIYERGQANGVRCELIDQARLRELEPHTAGLRAIHVPEAGIVDYCQVCQRLAHHIRAGGGQILLQARVNKMHVGPQEVVLDTAVGEVQAKYVINCAGLYSDRVTAMSGQKPEVKIVPFRGEYFEIKPAAKHLCRNLIYPVPDPSFPFLGVHFTRMTTGAVECGPNAVLAFAREGYRFRDINLRDLAESLTYSGFLRMASKHWKTGMSEMWRSLSKAAFVRALQRLVPEIKSEDLESAPAGVRAMALGRDGSLVDDFSIQEAGRVINVCNAPSPAATACLNVGRLIVEKLATRLT